MGSRQTKERARWIGIKLITVDPSGFSNCYYCFGMLRPWEPMANRMREFSALARQDLLSHWHWSKFFQRLSHRKQITKQLGLCKLSVRLVLAQKPKTGNEPWQFRRKMKSSEDPLAEVCHGHTKLDNKLEIHSGLIVIKLMVLSHFRK
jgi:hypothetical protein